MEINDVPYNDSIVHLHEDMICIRLSSKDNNACIKIHDIIVKLFSDSKWVYKAIGFLDDLELIAKFCNNENVKFFEGKSKFKLFTVSYPELHAEISDSHNLFDIINSWSSTIYNTYVLYIVSAENKNNVISILEKEVYQDVDSIYSTWNDIKIAIRNQPEAEYHNTFLLFTHRKYLECIQKILCL